MAVNKCPSKMPLEREYSSARPVDRNMEAKKIPAQIANRFPIKFPPESLSKKNKEIPAVVAVTVTISPKRNLWRKIRADKISINTGAQYCKTMALAAVVNLLAATKKIKVPERKKPHKKDCLLRTKGCFCCFLYS